MPSPSLLDRQSELLDFLTSPRAIFGADRAETGTSTTASPVGLDAGRLRLEAMFSHEKRMDKISAVFHHTWDRLGTGREALVRAFAAAYPPADTVLLRNAEQFFEFLTAWWRTNPPEPVYLPDLASYELAVARASRHGVAHGVVEARGAGQAVRRHPGLELVRLGHDIAPIFDDHGDDRDPVSRTTCVAIKFPVDTFEPHVSELPERLFDILSKLSDWVPLDALPLAEGASVRTIFEALERDGLVELSR